MPAFVALLLSSIIVNFAIGVRVAHAVAVNERPVATRWLTLGIVFDLGLLAYFKYADFFVANANAALGTHWNIGRVILPIGISFYTFTQIAYLVDTWRAKVRETNPIHYGLFVTYFPHLVAGPVLHHAQMMPQFALPSIYRFNTANAAAGLAIIAIGLFKKVVLADGMSPYADAVFKAADGGAVPEAGEAALATLAYTLQLYFDFSGYSDMAVGLSWLFNIRLPFNFDSPYRATSISDFWRRWHISLSNFLRDYLYIALGGNRHGRVRRYANLAATMVLGGLWHGAGWSFVFWGALHGAYLMVNHGFRALCGNRVSERLHANHLYKLLGWVLTMTAVMFAWVFFRAETLPGALRMIQALLGAGSADGQWMHLLNSGLDARTGWLWCAVLSALACLMPNSNRIGTRLRDAARDGSLACGFLTGMTMLLAVMLVVVNETRDAVSAFIYFNF